MIASHIAIHSRYITYRYLKKTSQDIVQSGIYSKLFTNKFSHEKFGVDS